ncbi:MAG: peptidoglycan DD-metalloendopeptidase family protein [bacterium]|nr:peptidoglycan DD-metalloendopeptidase family protein [bacterium]
MTSHRVTVVKTGLALAAFCAVVFLSLLSVNAGTLEDLYKGINDKKAEIAKLEEQARQYRAEIVVSQEKGKTLKGELARIDASIRQLRGDIAVTEGKVSRTVLEIQALALEIAKKQASIASLQAGLADAVRTLAHKEQEPFIIATFVRGRPLSDFFSALDALTQLKHGMLATVGTLHTTRADLQKERAQADEKRAALEDLQSSLAARKKIQETTQVDKKIVLAETRNQEQRYQQLLVAREKQKAALEDEVTKIEEQIKFTLDASSIPTQGRGVLGYPLPSVSLTSCGTTGAKAENCLTQHFGYTEFARTGGYGGIYGHNGVDFRAAIGTPVLSSESGVIAGVGDTDVGCRGASYGKWVLIRHDNHLATIYAHLSSINTSTGARVVRGTVIGYSGATGYATGPHLHFGLYAAEAVQIQTIQSKVCGRPMTLPIAPVNGYLDPERYL